MQLLSIEISNYRSIQHQKFLIGEIDGGHTYTLIGINESGKSSFLRAISLIDSGDAVYPKDFFDPQKEIEIVFEYRLTAQDEKELRSTLTEKQFDKELLDRIKIEKVWVCVKFDPATGTKRNNFEKILFQKDYFSEYALVGASPIKKDASGPIQEDFNLTKYFEEQLPQYFWKLSHYITFWKSDSKHLINDQISLDAFAAKPDETSIPLRNCFELAGITDIPAEIAKLKINPADINNLQERLGEKVTAHIKRVWPHHPIKIKFQINNSFLSFLIEDTGVKYNAKTVDQRSDGFRQFVSFLLTISAESANKQLSNSLLLLDEPETFLHPQAQEYLKDELINITKGKENNIVFFATHSTFMIDRQHIDRCFRVVKEGNKKTRLEQIQGGHSSYAEVNYEVFSIPTADYHNELYGYLEDVEPDEISKLDALPRSKDWTNKKTGKTEKVSLARYIRHSIHHPENDLNPHFTAEELVESIETLRKLKVEKGNGKKQSR